MSSGTNIPPLEDINVHDLLPQQEPFVMIDKLTGFSERSTSTRFMIRPENIFVEQGEMNACALAENIAQTCSARLGFVNKYLLKRGIQIGFIGAIRDMSISRCPKVGETLTTTINVLQDVMGVTLVDATVSSKDEILASAQMKIATALENKN